VASSYRTPEDLALLCEHARPMGNGFIARCPLHDDNTASLKISDGDKATVIWCHAGCKTADILAVWGVGAEQLFHDYNPHSSSSKQDLFMELKALKRELDPPPPLPATILGLISEAFSLPQPYHDQGLEMAADSSGAGQAPGAAMRMRLITRDTIVQEYFTPYASMKRMSGTKTMMLQEWGMKRLETYWRERKQAQ